MCQFRESFCMVLDRPSREFTNLLRSMNPVANQFEKIWSKVICMIIIIDILTTYCIHILKVIEEARRVLQIESNGHTVFMKECVGRLLEELEMMLYFGIHKGLNHPKSLKISKLLPRIMLHWG